MTNVQDIRSDNKKLNTGEFRRQSIVLKSRPVRAWISFSGKCNLSCVHCPRSGLDGSALDHSEMSSEIFGKLEADLFPFLDECKIGGNSLGEQLLAKQWESFCERISRYPFSRTLVTNGLLLSSGKIAKLIGSGWTIDYSTEGATRETYQRIRGADFDKFVALVHESCRQKKSLGEPRANIRLCLTAFHDNIRELPELIRLGARLGVDEIHVTHLIPMREYQRNQSLTYHKGLANSAFEEGFRLAQELGILLKLPPPFQIQRMDAPHETESDGRVRNSLETCRHPWESVSVTETGDVMPCCLFETPMGNLREAGFEDIWNHRKYQKLRETVNSRAPRGKCRNCPLRGNEFTSVNCNDERALLSAIGLTNHMDARSFVRLKLREISDGSPWKKAVLQKLRALYRKLTFS